MDVDDTAAGALAQTPQRAVYECVNGCVHVRLESTDAHVQRARVRAAGTAGRRRVCAPRNTHSWAGVPLHSTKTLSYDRQAVP